MIIKIKADHKYNDSVPRETTKTHNLRQHHDLKSSSACKQKNKLAVCLTNIVSRWTAVNSNFRHHQIPMAL
jgi:hypothetical protein